jgi:hypothetical protein
MGRSVQVGDHPDDLPFVTEIEPAQTSLSVGIRASRALGKTHRLTIPQDRIDERRRRDAQAGSRGHTPALATDEVPANRGHRPQIATRKR